MIAEAHKPDDDVTKVTEIEDGPVRTADAMAEVGVSYQAEPEDTGQLKPRGPVVLNRAQRRMLAKKRRRAK